MLWTPSHPVDMREIVYVLNQCYISRAIWPTLNEKFMVARTNEFQERDALAFLDFALGLRTEGIKHYLPREKKDILQRELYDLVVRFFQDYEIQEGERNALINPIVASLESFVESLSDPKTGRVRPLFLEGIGGVGKTKFASLIQQRLLSVISGESKIAFYNETVDSPTSLEGSSEKPGLFLRVLQKMCESKSLGAIVMMDEATWMNEDSYVSAAKRTFNGEFSEIRTDYFGGGSDGRGIAFEMPPLLVILASNKSIADDALKSRFEHINFPLPKKEALEQYAYKLLDKSGWRKEGVATLESVRQETPLVTASLNNDDDERVPLLESQHSISNFSREAAASVPSLRQMRNITEVHKTMVDEKLGIAKTFRDVESFIPQLLVHWKYHPIE